MALSQNDIRASYPLPVYNYRVEINGEAIAFSEVSGLSIGFETHTYKESQTAALPGPRVYHMLAQPTPTTLTLKRGIVPAISMRTFYQWINQTVLNQIEKKDIVVRLCDEQGDPVISWKVLNAFPTKLDAPTFDANSNEVAIESMELMADAIQVEVS